MRILSDNGIAVLHQFKDEVTKLAIEEKEDALMTRVRATTLEFIDLVLANNTVSFWEKEVNKQRGATLLTLIVGNQKDNTPHLFNPASCQFARIILKYIDKVEFTKLTGTFLGLLGSKKFLEICKIELALKIELFEVIEANTFDKKDFEKWLSDVNQFKQTMRGKIEKCSATDAGLPELHSEYCLGLQGLMDRLAAFPYISFPQNRERLSAPSPNAMEPSALRGKLRKELFSEEKNLNQMLKAKGCDLRLQAVYFQCKLLVSSEEKEEKAQTLLSRINQFKTNVVQLATHDKLKSKKMFSSEMDPIKVTQVNLMMNQINDALGLAENFCLNMQRGTSNQSFSTSIKECKKLNVVPLWQITSYIFRAITATLKENIQNVSDKKSISPIELTNLLKSFALEFQKMTLSVANEECDASLRKAVEEYEQLSDDKPFSSISVSAKQSL